MRGPVRRGAVPGRRPRARESESLTITARLAPGTTAGTVITNTVDASTLSPDLATANNTSSVTVTAAGDRATSTSRRVVSPTSVVAGAGDATYTITVTNQGPSTATGIVLSDPSPALAVVSGSSSRGTVHLRCPGELHHRRTARRRVGEVHARRRSPRGLRSRPDHQHRDRVRYPARSGSLDNSASATLNVTTSADLVTIKQGPAQLVPGGTGTYEITVSNTGPSTALAVALVDQLPAGIVVDQVTPDVGTCQPVVVGQH